MAQRLIGHDRAKVRAADADVDHVANAFARVAFPFAAAHTIGEFGHLIEDGMDFGNNVLAVHHDLFTARRAQRHVQHRPVLGEVDLVAAEHRIDFPAQAAFVGQAQQQPQGLVGEAMLGIVEIQPRRFQRKALAARGILCEQRPEMNLFDFPIMRRQRHATRDLALPASPILPGLSLQISGWISSRFSFLP